MGLAWEIKHLSPSNYPTQTWQFFLAHRDPTTRTYTNAVQVLEKTLREIPRPLDLWLLDFRSPIELESHHCFPDQRYRGWAGEYKYKLYHCTATATTNNREQADIGFPNHYGYPRRFDII